jgi:hypothetical protein
LSFWLTYDLSTFTIRGRLATAGVIQDERFWDEFKMEEVRFPDSWRNAWQFMVFTRLGIICRGTG